MKPPPYPVKVGLYIETNIKEYEHFSVIIA
jgi:hypothetical protein